MAHGRRRAAVALRGRMTAGSGSTSGAWASPATTWAATATRRSYLTSMFGNRLETLVDGPARPQFENIARERGVESGRPVAGDDERPSTSWHPEFEDVNNDGPRRPVRLQGQPRRHARSRHRRPQQPAAGRTPTGASSSAPRRPASSTSPAHAGRRVVDLNLDGLLDIVEVNLGEPVEVWRNVGAGASDDARADGSLARRRARTGGRQPRRHRRLDRGQGPGRDAATRGHRRRRPRQWPAGPAPLRAGRGEAERRCGCSGPMAKWGPWQRVAADELIRIDRDAQPFALDPAAGSPGSLTSSPHRRAADGWACGRRRCPAIEPIDPATCVRTTDPDKSVARLWDEALLDAIRRDFPAPTVHARNLYHTSAAMWDAWAAYDPVADGVFVNREDRARRPGRGAREGHQLRRLPGPLAPLPERRWRGREPAAVRSSSWPTCATPSSARPPGVTRRRPSATASPRRIIAAGLAGRLARGPRLQLSQARLPAGQRAHDRVRARARSCATPTAGSRWRWRRRSPRTDSCSRSGHRSSWASTGGRSRPSRCPPADDARAHRPGRATAARRPRHRRRVQGPGGGGPCLQQPARPRATASSSTSRPRPWATTPSAPTTAPATRATPAPASPTRRSWCLQADFGRARRRVLGRRP